MEKINFVNNQQPALNATNLNKLQDNVENSIDELDNSIIGEVLYENSTGTLTSLTVNVDLTGYKKIVLELVSNAYTEWFKTEYLEIYNPQNKSYTKSFAFYNHSNNRVYVVCPRYVISYNNTITIENNQAGAVGANEAYTAAADCFKITKVIGYK